MKFLAVCVLTVSLVVVVHSSVLQPRGYGGGGGGGGYGGGFGMKMSGGGGAKGGTKGGPKGGLKGGKGEGGYGGGKEGGYGGEDKYGSDSEDSGVTVKELQITVKTLYSTYCKVTGKSDDVVAKMGSGFSYDKMKSAMAKYGYTCESDNEGKSSKGKKGKGGDSVQQLKDMCSYMYSKFCDATRQPKVKGFSMEAIKKAIAKYNSGSCGGGEGGDDKGYGSYGGKGGKGGKPGSYKPSGIGKYGDDDEGSNEDEEGGNGSYKSYGGKGGKSGGGYKGGKKPAGGYEGGDDEHEDEED